MLRSIGMICALIHALGSGAYCPVRDVYVVGVTLSSVNYLKRIQTWQISVFL